MNVKIARVLWRASFFLSSETEIQDEFEPPCATM